MAAAQVDRGEGKENGAPKEEPKEEEMENPEQQ